jgi:hypothetical protein
MKVLTRKTGVPDVTKLKHEHGRSTNDALKLPIPKSARYARGIDQYLSTMQDLVYWHEAIVQARKKPRKLYIYVAFLVGDASFELATPAV